MRTIFVFVALLMSQLLIGANQTATVSSIGSESSLPFTISLEQESLLLPAGIHSGACGSFKGKWVFIAGRTNGLHGFGVNPFPPLSQNTVVYVVDIAKQTVHSRDITDASSGLTQDQINQLSVTSPQSFYRGKTLYMCGGYGVNTGTGAFSTFPVLTAIDMSKLIKWVKNGTGSVASAIRQTSLPWMQVTGGYMNVLDNRLQGLLIFGQNFEGVYTPSSNGIYTQQVRRFQIVDTGKKLFVQTRDSESPKPEFRRRDLNVVPIINNGKPAFLAISGVFTLTTGVWTVPVLVNADGSTKMKDPNDPSTFKQGMNNYISSKAELYSNSTKDMYVVQMGGLSFGFFSGGTFTTDSEVPFINQVTTLKMDKDGNFSQFLMNNEFPVILSTGTNPGNRLIFGAGAAFMNADGVSTFPNRVIDLDKLKGPTTVGYVVGGIMSTLANTVTTSDSTASPYIFRLVVTPR